MNELNIDIYELATMKNDLNLALNKAVRTIQDMETATITLKIEIMQSEEGDDSKTLMPIEYTCTVSKKRDIMKDKGSTPELIAKEDDAGHIQVMSKQMSVFDMESGND